MEAHEQLAARHIALRERAGLTQEQEAKLAGVSPTTISGIESGKIARPHLKTLLKLAQALGAEVGELRESGKVAAPSPEQPSLNGLLEDERRIIRGSAHLRGTGKLEASWERIMQVVKMHAAGEISYEEAGEEIGEILTEVAA